MTPPSPTTVCADARAAVWILPEDLARTEVPSRARASAPSDTPTAFRGLPGQRTAPAIERTEPAIDRGVWIEPPPRVAAEPAPPGAAEPRPRVAAQPVPPVAAEPPSPAARPPRVRSWRRRVRRPALAAAVAAALLLGSGAGTTFGDDTRQFTVTVDGVARTFTTAGATVGDALTSVGIDVHPRDVLVPAAGTPIDDGDAIALRRSRPVTVTVDGQRQRLWTTATTLDAALRQLGIDDIDYQVAADRSRRIGPQGLSVTGHRLHTVTIVDGTDRPVMLRSTGVTVADVLDAQRISLGAKDRVRPAPTTEVSEGTRIVVTRVSVTERTERRSIPQPEATTVADSTLGKGNSVVRRRGHPGVRELTIRSTTVNGSTTEKVTGNTVVRRPQAKVTRIGTKETGLPESWSVPWDQMAFCESTGRWHVNTGNGTYGGLQFQTSTWLAFGGGEFAPRADLATKEQQIIVAERLYAEQGLAPWHCARLLGWGFGRYEG